MNLDGKNKLLVVFCMKLAPSDEIRQENVNVPSANGVPDYFLRERELKEFYERSFHPEVMKHSRRLFCREVIFTQYLRHARLTTMLLERKQRVRRMGKNL